MKIDLTPEEIFEIQLALMHRRQVFEDQAINHLNSGRRTLSKVRALVLSKIITKLENYLQGKTQNGTSNIGNN